MLQEVENSRRYFAYTSSGEPLYVYCLGDYEDSTILASKKQVSKEQIEEAVKEHDALMKNRDQIFDDLARKHGKKDYIDEDCEDTEEYREAQNIASHENPYITLEEYLGKKYEMHPFVFEASAWGRA